MYSPYINACSSLVGSRRTLMMGSGRARLLRSALRARPSAVSLHLRGGVLLRIALPVLEACCDASTTFNRCMNKNGAWSRPKGPKFSPSLGFH